MKLIEFSHKAGDWEINNLVLGDVNLIVGENAVGKSKTVGALNLFPSSITFGTFFTKLSYSYKVTFLLKNGSFLKYEMSFSEGAVKKEVLIIDDYTLIYRDEKKAFIKSKKNDLETSIAPPSHELILKIRRDIVEFPEFECLISWAESLHFFTFNSDRNYEPFEEDILNSFETLNINQRSKIISFCNKVGFNILQISSYNKNNYQSKEKGIKFKEKSVKADITYWDLSEGMRRAIRLIVFLEHQIEKSNGNIPTLIIDDLGEGLDYQKATNLGKYVFERCKEAGIQLIATSNDNFLMDVIDLEHWNILTRKGSKVSAINKTTHPKIFEDFMFTGLSNFSLLTSDYLNRKLKELETV